MSALRRRLQRMRTSGSAGLTLVELLVAMSLAVVLMAITLSAVGTSQSAVVTSKQEQDLNEEARQAINRMARDIRQANRVITAVNPDRPAFAANSLVAVRFHSDFDGDRCIGGVPMPGATPAPTCVPYNVANPEDLTYCYEPATRQLYIIDNVSTVTTPVSAPITACTGGQPLLAGNVGGFVVEYRSNQYRYDINPSDGVTTWRELDESTAPVGNSNGQLDVELANVDSVVLNVTMRVSSRQQAYRTQVDLRNVSR